MRAKKNTNNNKNNKEKLPSLVKEILSDLLIKNWLISLLVVIVILSAMFKAKTSHEVRRAFADYQQLREERQQQDINLQKHRLEVTSLSEANRILSLAKKELGMIKVNDKNERVITL
jgi:cell division protein FtsL